MGGDRGIITGRKSELQPAMANVRQAEVLAEHQKKAEPRWHKEQCADAAILSLKPCRRHQARGTPNGWGRNEVCSPTNAR